MIMSLASEDNAIFKGRKRQKTSVPLHFYFAATHQQALEQEISLLQSLLKRNRCSHQRTKYYQRLSMSLAAIKRHAIPQLYGDLSSLLAEVQARTTHYRQKRKREQVFWSNTNSNQDDYAAATTSEIQSLWIKSESIGRTSVVQGLPECLSRLEYAAQALFAETVRGFFLPLCTVAVAVISRIRALLLRLGQFALQECLPQLQTEWKELLSAVTPRNENDSGGKATFAATTEIMPDRLWGQESSHNNGEHGDTSSSDAFSRARTVVMTGVHEASLDFSSRTRSERTQSMLESLGLSSMHARLDTSTHSKSTKCVTECEGIAEAASRVEEVVLPNKMQSESHEMGDNAKESADVGDAVRPRKEDDATVWSIGKSSLGTGGMISADGVDLNGEIVQKLKAQRKKSKTMKKRKGEPSTHDAGSKKKKRSKKGDFFDDLFAK